MAGTLNESGPSLQGLSVRLMQATSGHHVRGLGSDVTLAGHVSIGVLSRFTSDAAGPRAGSGGSYRCGYCCFRRPNPAARMKSLDFPDLDRRNQGSVTLRFEIGCIFADIREVALLYGALEIGY